MRSQSVQALRPVPRGPLWPAVSCTSTVAPRESLTSRQPGARARQDDGARRARRVVVHKPRQRPRTSRNARPGSQCTARLAMPSAQRPARRATPGGSEERHSCSTISEPRRCPRLVVQLGEPRRLSPTCGRFVVISCNAAAECRWRHRRAGIPRPSHTGALDPLSMSRSDKDSSSRPRRSKPPRAKGSTPPRR